MKIDQRKYQAVQTEEIGTFALETHQKRLELVDPSKRTLGTEVMLADYWIEQSLPTTLEQLTVALVLGNVWNNAMIEANLPCSFGIKRAIGIQVRTFDSDLLLF